MDDQLGRIYPAPMVAAYDLSGLLRTHAAVYRYRYTYNFSRDVIGIDL